MNKDIDKLRELEESLWPAETRFDQEYMNKILSDDFFEFGRSGRMYTREQSLSAPSQEINAKLPLEDFKDANIIFVAGGNTFYLLEKTRESGFDDVIRDLVEKGILYAGGSAGACLAGPDIEPIGAIDHPEKVPNLKSTKSLGLVDFVVVPHFDNEKYQDRAKDIVKKYKNKFKLVPLNDDQAVLVEGDNYKIVKSN